MEKNKETLEELKEYKNSLLLILIPFIVMLLGGIFIICYENSVAGIIIGGLLIGFAVAVLTTLSFFIGKTNEQITLKAEELQKRLKDSLEKYNDPVKEIKQTIQEAKIYDNLRFRDRVLKNKFGYITNEKLKKDFLKTHINYYITINDAIGCFELYNFYYKQEYKEILESFERKQAILNDYSEKPKKKKNTKV